MGVSYSFHGWTEKGAPYVDATPYVSITAALQHARGMHSQGLLSKARIVASDGGITDWPEIKLRLGIKD